MRGRDLLDRVLPFLPAAIFGAAMASAWFGDGGLRDRRDLTAALSQVEAETSELQRSNAVLEQHRRALTDDPGVIERKAREELDMVRPDEQVFRFVESDE